MVHHIGVESSEGLEKLRGSKYLQSNTENTYTEAQNELKRQACALFRNSMSDRGIKKYSRQRI